MGNKSAWFGLSLFAVLLITAPDRLRGACSYCGSMEMVKEYILPEHVLITEEGIFHMTEEGAVPVTVIGKDEQGLYAMAAKVTWKCKCGRVYPCWVSHCPKCEKKKN